MSILSEGDHIRGSYRIERMIGEGAFAEVYRVQHRFLGRQAMKVFKDEVESLEDVERMLSEAVLLSKIGHPNVIRVFDADVLERKDGHFGFFTMEYVPGGSLDSYWRSYRNSLMPVKDAVEILQQVCAGIGLAHSENPPIVHRDIKPQNILIGYDGSGTRVRVGDFGLAKRVNPLTLLVSARGTLGFKPPESFENMDSPAADVWSLGTTLYLLLTDSFPYPELVDRDIAKGVTNLGKARPPSFYNAIVDEWLDSIVSKCLYLDPAARYPTAIDLGRDLIRWQNESDQEETSKRVFVESGSSKDILGSNKEMGKSGDAKIKASRALELAKQPGRLTEAADLLEEAITKLPDIRAQYEPLIRLWRRGICM
ncbi:serine/threonine protein kinase [bacterium]|nr:serine/threonine protein kinase [bacterium]